jgi:AcrR family transcriptional regulator
MPRRSNDPEGVRRKIVDAAFKLFTTEGYNGTPMHAVRDLAGVSSGALAHHFPTKRDLGLAVIREPVAEAISETWIKPVTQASSAIAGVQLVFETTIADVNRAGTVAGCPLGNLTAELSTRDEAFRSEIRLIFDQWKDAIAGSLQRQQATDTSSDRDPIILAGFIVACFSGAILMAKASQSSVPLQVCSGQVRRLLEERECDES